MGSPAGNLTPNISDIIAPNAVMEFLPKVYGPVFMRAEAQISHLMRLCIDGWSGGSIRYAYAGTSDGLRAGFMYPVTSDETVTVRHPAFGTEATLTPALAGMFCSTLGVLILLEKYCAGELDLSEAWAERLDDTRRNLLAAGAELAAEAGMGHDWFRLTD